MFPSNVNYFILFCNLKSISNVFSCLFFSRYSWEEETITYYLSELQRKGLVKSLDHGAYTRMTVDDTDVQVHLILFAPNNAFYVIIYFALDLMVSYSCIFCCFLNEYFFFVRFALYFYEALLVSFLRENIWFN